MAKPTCPCCRKEYSARNPSKFHLNLLNKIFLSCPNEENGCDKRLNYYEFYEHEQNCTYYKFTCLNEGCEEQLLKKEELEHRLICQFEKLECFFCEQPQQRNQISYHYYICHQTDCDLISTLFCKLCGIGFDFNQIRYHFHKGGKKQIQLKVEAKMRLISDYQKVKSQKPIYTQPSYNKKRKLNYR